jgi:hypothetical protein
MVKTKRPKAIRLKAEAPLRHSRPNRESRKKMDPRHAHSGMTC